MKREEGSTDSDRIITHTQVRRYTESGDWTGTLLHDHVERWSAEMGGTTAVVGSYLGVPDKRLSYAELQSEIARASSALKALGVRKGDVVAIQLPNWIEFLVVLLAAIRVGAVACPITHIYRQFEMRFILKRTRCRVLFVPDTFRNFDYLQMAVGLLGEVPDLEKVIVVGQAAETATVSFSEFLGAGQRSGDDHQVRPDANDVAILAFTSGTTGEPKGVMHTHNTLQAVINSAVRHMGIEGHIVSLVASPVGHLTGVIWGCLMTTMLGGKVVFLDRWDVSNALKQLEVEGVTTVAGATPFLRDLTYSEKLRPEAVMTLRTFICAGAPIPPMTVSDAVERLGCKVHSAWGMSEYPIATAVAHDDEQEMAVISDGRSCPGAEVRIVDPGGQPILHTGAEGDLEVKGVGLFAGYYKRPDFNRDSLTDDGFLRTGDRAYRVADGRFIRIAGRSKDIIIRGGENIPVFDIESLLTRHPKIADVALVAAPDERLGERACAYVVLKPGITGITLDEIAAFLMQQQVAKQFLPEQLELIEELPRTPSGKVQKFRLRASLVGGDGSDDHRPDVVT